MELPEKEQDIHTNKKKKKTYKDLYEFLNHVRVKKGDKITHTSMGKGSYYIKKKHQKTFLKLYYEHVFVNGKKSYLTEKHMDIAPILIDCDFKFKANKRERQYTQQHIIKILSYYRQFLLKHVAFTQKKQYLAFVFEKAKPILAGYKDEMIVKDGIHIIFPYINLAYPLQYMMRNYVIEHCPDIFGDLELINNYSDVIDESVIKRNNWLMYGSRKPDKYGVEQDAYQLTNIYDIKNEPLQVVENTYTNKQLISLLSLQINRDTLCAVKDGVDKLIENFTINNVKKKITSKRRKITSTKRRKKSPKKIAKDSDLEIYKKMVSLLSVDRANKYKTWYDVGLCLHNIDHRLLKDWIAFSKKSPKFQPGECQIKWHYMDTNELGLSVGSLYLWAKQDNVDGFNKVISEDLKTYIYRSLKSISHSDIGLVVYKKFQHHYICASNKHKTWFQFKNHRWCEIDNGVSLRRALSKSIVNEYRDFSVHCSHMAKTHPDEEDLWDERAKACYKIINKLKDVGFKEKIMKECADLFYEYKFLEKLDSKRHLLGFENGVYDLEKHEFRDGIPEDFMSYSTKINYIELTEDDDEHIQNIELFLSQILPNESVREYVLRLFSSFLTGKIGHEKIHFWTGSGGNGKSKIIELFEMCLGDYCCKLPVSIFSRSRAASNACTPELVRTKGKRFVSLQEPDSDVPFNVGLMKELTGGDTIQARGLHKDPIEFKPQFKLILICNDLPEIQRMDGGVERRLRVVEFKSKFVPNPDENNPNEYLMDTELDEKMEQWPEIFIQMLLKKYKTYKEEGNTEPPEVLLSTNQYKDECDIFSSFFKEMIVEKPGAKLKLTQVYHIFKLWYIKTGDTKRLPQQRYLKKEMCKKYGEYKLHWRGIAIKKDTYESEEDTFD